MKQNSGTPKYLPLNDARIYYNQKKDSFEITGKSSDIENGFLMNVPQDSKMEEKLRKAFGLEPKINHGKPEMPNENLFISYSEPLKETELILLDNKRFENPERRLVSKREDAKGKVITVTSPRQGTGKTTVASILASQLAHSSSDNSDEPTPLKVCIVEAGAVQQGLSNLLFHFEPKKPTLLNLALQEKPLDIKSISDHLLYHDALNFHVLLGIIQENTAHICSTDFYAQLLKLLKQMFDVIIFDVPEAKGGPEEVPFWNFIFDNSDRIFLVTDLNPASVYGLKNWAQTSCGSTAEGGYGLHASKIEVVVNKYVANGEISFADITKMAEGLEVSTHLPWIKTIKDASRGEAYLKSALFSGPESEIYSDFTTRLMQGIGLDAMKLIEETPRGLRPRYLNGQEFLNIRPSEIMVGCTSSDLFSMIDLKNPKQSNVMITGKDSQGSQSVLENIRSFLNFSPDPYDVISYGMKPDAVKYDNEESIEDSLELLIKLRKISVDIVKGVKYTVPKVIIMADMDDLVYSYWSELSRVDKAVRAEILDLLRSLSTDNSTDLINFVFVSQNPSMEYSAFMTNCGYFIHCGVPKEHYKAYEFLNRFIPDYPAPFFDGKEGRAVVKSNGVIEMVQVAKPISFKGDVY